MRTVSKLGVLALCAALPLLMAQGGFPSRPKFQAVGIGLPASTAGQLLTLGHTTNPYVVVSDTDAAADTKNVYLQNLGGGIILGFCNDAVAACAGVLSVTRNAGLNTAATINLVATTVQSNGVRVPRHAFASLTAGAGCSVNAAYTNQGVSGCSRTGVGTYTATLNAGFTDEPVCTFSTTSVGGARMHNGIATTTTNVAVDTFDAAGAAADTSQISLVCVGP